MANTRTAAFANEPGELLTRGQTLATSLTTGATYTKDIEVQGFDSITVQGNLVGDADANLTVTVMPFEEDNLTIGIFTLVPTSSVGATHSGGKVEFIGRYDVRGFSRVRITWKNNHTNTKVLTRASWQLED